MSAPTPLKVILEAVGIKINSNASFSKTVVLHETCDQQGPINSALLCVSGDFMTKNDFASS